MVLKIKKKKLYLLGLVLILATLTLCFQKNVFVEPLQASNGTTTINFQPTNENFLNPERGIYRRSSLHASSNYSSLRGKGLTLIHAYIRLDNFRNSYLSQAFLDDLNGAFQRLREAKIKAAFRFSYNHSIDGADAPKEWIMRHIDQLKPILQANTDVILAMEAGFIGPWGEWWKSSNGLANTQDRKDVLFKVLDALPADRMVLVRRPAYKMDIFGRMFEESEAFSGSRIARTGHNNDGILYDGAGSYKGHNKPPEYWKAWIAHESQFTPVGGETTCHTDVSKINCADAYADFSYMHWTYLNDGWCKDVVDKLKNLGCWEVIKKYLGYRFVLDNLQVSTQVAPGGQMSFRLTLHNEGYAALFNQRPVFLVLEKKTGGYKQAISLSSASNPKTTDPRWWQSGQTVVINEQITIPSNAPEGSYNLYLWLPDAYQNLRGTPEYSIRMANANIWQASTGYNLLFNNLNISGAPPTCAGPGDIDCDQDVDADDMRLVLKAWGRNLTSREDAHPDGKVNLYDAAVVVGNWAP